jgi:hypothetical protein
VAVRLLVPLKEADPPLHQSDPSCGHRIDIDWTVTVFERGGDKELLSVRISASQTAQL